MLSVACDTGDFDMVDYYSVVIDGASESRAADIDQGALGGFGPLKKVASLRAQGALGAFGSLKKIASLRDPCPESLKMVGYTLDFMPRTSQDGRRSRPFGVFPGMK